MRITHFLKNRIEGHTLIKNVNSYNPNAHCNIQQTYVDLFYTISLGLVGGTKGSRQKDVGLLCTLDIFRVHSFDERCVYYYLGALACIATNGTLKSNTCVAELVEGSSSLLTSVAGCLNVLSTE